jgi:4-hydroxy-3-polyprenylbenzoate decarboxylase
MGYRTLKSCIDDLRRTRQLIEFNEEVDPHLELAAVQRRLYAAGAPAVLFTKPKNCRFPMLANLFGTEKRVEYIFRDGIEPLRKAIELGADPLAAAQQISLRLGMTALTSLYYSRPKRVAARSAPVLACETTLDQLPQLVSWQDDGGAYWTLPQVYTESLSRPGFGNSNLGMYRVQISGNDYIPNEECGLHYQIHRGIAGHHAEALAAGVPLRVAIFIGGAPCMTLAAVMPLPEGMSELLFAGILGQHRIPMTLAQTADGRRQTAAEERSLPSADSELRLCLPSHLYAEADFCIVGTMYTETKREGPFGDHLGYYSLAHDFPVLKVERVYHRKDAVFPFTVVGRPPQEDTQFGKFIHHLVGDAVPKKIPGVCAVHAVDEAGVHPLLLAIGRESYLPLDPSRRAAELHTLAHALLGYGQLSLVKYLFLAAEGDDPNLSVYDAAHFLQHSLRRVDWRNDVHFVTKTTADTLDYTDGELNRGSKLFVAVSGKPRRQLAETLPSLPGVKNPRLAMPGVVCAEEIDMHGTFPENIPLMVLVDNATDAASSLRNFLWTTFTKSDPARDVSGIGEFIDNKHWGCTGALIINAKRKPHHAPELVELPEVARRADEMVETILRH